MNPGHEATVTRMYSGGEVPSEYFGRRLSAIITAF
jgi:hypothetical protein